MCVLFFWDPPRFLLISRGGITPRIIQGVRDQGRIIRGVTGVEVPSQSVLVPCQDVGVTFLGVGVSFKDVGVPFNWECPIRVWECPIRI